MTRARIAVVGATGAVGREMFAILEERRFPFADVVPFASPRSEGKPIRLGDRTFPCQVLKPGCFDGIQLAFFDASDAVSREWVPQAAESGAWVVDNSATYRMEQDIPLLVPEVNMKALAALLKPGARPTARQRIIAGPNCTTVQLVVALKPLHERFGLKRVVVSTYQSASGAGTAAMEELSQQAKALLNHAPRVAPQAFAHQIAFNTIPHIGGFKDDGYTSEEHKIIQETRKILELPALRITATSVRVPTLSCHGESVNIETEKPCSPEDARRALAEQAGVVLQDEPKRGVYPMPMPGPEGGVEGASGRDAVYVGRVRRDASVEHGLNLWIVSDNLRKGAALNAVQVGEKLLPSLG
jgi:aspartate-semialdehyde dehydrogenase